MNADNPQQLSPVILALAQWYKGEPTSPPIFELMQRFGFVTPAHDELGKFLGYQITPSGTQTLQEFNLL
jgi:hypothetical protein